MIKTSGWMGVMVAAWLMVGASFAAEGGDKLVIAHRAASGYLMEHNLPSVALAVGMGSDYIEQDLVLTRDDQLIVLHDPTLDRVTDVAEVFPGRNRQDGKFYALDFTLAEIKQLRVREPYFNIGNGEGRFPDTGKELRLSVPTFREELELIRGLEKTMGREIGIYPEIKQPWLHRKEGRDISMAVLRILREFGYTDKSDKIYLQCFDPDELKRIHTELFPALGMELKLVQLIDDNSGNETKSLEWGEWVNYNYDWILSKSGLRALASYVSGIGVEKSRLVDETGKVLLPELVNDAHNLGMEVHAYTFRREKESLPPYVADFDGLLEFFYFKLGVDGLFTDYCGDAVQFLRRRASATSAAPAAEASGDQVAPPPPPSATDPAGLSPDSADSPAASSVAPELRGPVASDSPLVEATSPAPDIAPVAPPVPVDPRLPITISGPEPASRPAEGSRSDPAAGKVR